MMSKFFIEHPVLANVLAIVLVADRRRLRSTVCRCPQYPNVVPPTVQVTASYPGASAQTVINTVALPIETAGQRRRSACCTWNSTSASDGTYSLTVTFADRHRSGYRPGAGAEPGAARARLAAAGGAGAGRQRAEEEHRDPADRHAGLADGQYDSLYLTNYATINLTNELARLPGVGSVKVFGAGSYSMRVWMDPQKLFSFGLVPKDVIDAIRQQSQNVAAGQVGMPPAPSRQAFQYTVDIQSRLNDPSQFGDIVVKDQTAQGGRLIRVQRHRRASSWARRPMRRISG